MKYLIFLMLFGCNGETLYMDDGPSSVSSPVTEGPGATPYAINITSPPPITTAEVGEEFYHQVSAYSTRNLLLTYGLQNEPAGMNIHSKTGVITWTPTAGQISSGAVLITVTDQNGNREEQVLHLTVSQIGTDPTTPGSPGDGPTIPPLEIEEGDEITDPPEATPTGPITISSSPPTSAQTGDEITYQVDASSSTNLVLSYSLSNAPIGMRVLEKTGVVYWTPVKGQTTSGAVVITVTDSDGNTKTQNLNITVTDTNPTYPKMFFVATDGDSKNTGAPDSPFDDIRRACDSGAGPGDTVYVRGGIYRSPDFGSGKKEKPDGFRHIDCSGSEAGGYITIKPWGNEKVKFEFDSFVGLRLKGSYIIFEGFEIEGRNHQITYQEALSAWWYDLQYYNGTGIVIGADNAIVRNNIVHHTPGAGIQADNEYITIENNVVYNCAWWSTKGTTGIGVTSIPTIAGSTGTNIKVLGNLVFGSESRIFSRVLTKPYSHLDIDEGEAMLVQMNAVEGDPGSYKGRTLLENNFWLFNGKGNVVNIAYRTDVFNNTMYQNISTSNGGYGLRINNSNDVVQKRNAVHVSPGLAYSSCKDNCTNVINEDNYLFGDDDPDKLVDNNSGNYLVPKVFNDPENLDFSIVSEITNIPGYVPVGASMATWDKLKGMVDEYGIEIKPTGYVPDRTAMTKWIVENPPSGSIPTLGQDCDGVSDPLRVCMRNISEGFYESKGQVELRIVHPY